MDARQYLLSLEKFGIKFGLSNIRALTSALGDPQASFRSLLIAGTNGKGSVAAMVDCALRAAGLEVGRYTSPHLVHLEERFTIGGQPVASSVLTGLIDEVRTVVDGLLARGTLDAPPTFFEVTTAVALELFRRAGIDVAVVEVGLGGRLDSTNVLDPIAAAVTSIDFDHEQYLGHTLGAIAAEKAGIVRPDIPVIAGPLADEAREVLVSACRQANARFLSAEEGVTVETATALGRTTMRLRTVARDYRSVALGLRGDHQVPNALVAVRLLESLELVLPITPEAIVAGLRDVRWPGRLQMLEVDGGRRVLLDAAHNPAGTEALARYLEREFAGPLPIVFGAMKDKNVARMLQTLLPRASIMVMAEPAMPRAWPSSELAALARTIAPGSIVEACGHPRAALERAWAACPLACGAGSIFLVGELLASLGASARDV